MQPEPGHAQDCPGCVWEQDLTREDREFFRAHGGPEAHLHERRPPPPRENLAVWRAWLHEQYTAWFAHRAEGWRWPCPLCADPHCEGVDHLPHVRAVLVFNGLLPVSDRRPAPHSRPRARPAWDERTQV